MVFMAQAHKRPVWVASGVMSDGVRTYGSPVQYMWNWRGLSTDAEMQAFGPEYMDYRQAVCPNSDLDNIKRFDRVWLESEPPTTIDQLAATADSYVVGVTQGAGGVGTVLFKRLSQDG